MKNLLAVLGLCGCFGVTLDASAISITILVDSPNKVVYDVVWPGPAPAGVEQSQVHATHWDLLAFDMQDHLEVNASNIGFSNPIQVFLPASVVFASEQDRSANDAVVTPLGDAIGGLQWTTNPGNPFELLFTFEIKGVPDQGMTFALLGLSVLLLGCIKKFVFA